MSSLVTKSYLKEVFPNKLRNSITDEIVDSINAVCTDPMFAENFAENLLTYTSVLDDGRYKLADYVNAVKYVSCKLLNKSDKVAYSIALPERHARMLAEGYTDKEISSYVSAYKSGKLVQGILTQTMTPSYVLNMGLYQEGINKLAQLMRSADSERVQMESADKLLDKIKPPETSIVSIDVGTRNNDAIKDLENSMAALVAQQKQMLQDKSMSVGDMAKSKLVLSNDTGDVIDV